MLPVSIKDVSERDESPWVSFLGVPLASESIQDDLPRPEFWDWFQDLADARSAQSMSARTRVVAVALDPEDADQLIEAIGGPGQPFFALVARQIPATGTLLGYEVVGAEATLDSHSQHHVPSSRSS